MSRVLAPVASGVGASTTTPTGFLPFPSGSSVFVSQGNCVNGGTGIPNPTHCDQFGHYAWDMVYARGGQPIS